MPLYLFLFVFVAFNYKKNWWWWVIFFLCTVALTDMAGTQFFKHVFERDRPCRDPNFHSYVRMLVKCAGGYSFISNHAANHFGMATFSYFTLRHYLPKWAWIGFPWAFFICYAQVYVGVHYPFDVIVGALVGIIFGLFTALFFNRKFGFANFDRQPMVTS